MSGLRQGSIIRRSSESTQVNLPSKLASHTYRKAAIASGGYDAVICAVIEIQRVWRGYKLRQRLVAGLSMTAIYGGSKHQMERIKDFYNEGKSAALKRLEDVYSVYVTELMDNKSDITLVMSFEEYAARIIQKWWTDIWIRRLKRTGRWSAKHKYVTELIRKRGIEKEPMSEEDAAMIIQRMWRRHIDREVYRYYRDLINFRSIGDPSLMLRCINPNEAKLLDPASGIHVRFRLAGETFPPNIYYKIYTHRNIVDMCANSPKDYVRTKKPSCKQLNNNIFDLPTDDATRWYKRIENNGWRLVSDRIISHVMKDTITFKTSRKPIEFHHCKLQRKQDLAKKRKQKKIEWMQKLYSQGMMYPKADDPDTAKLVDGVAVGMLAAIDSTGTEHVEDWEVDQLLEWTTGLNYEEYANGWTKMATSSNSEKCIEQRLQLSHTADPYEFTLSTAGVSQYQSRSQSNARASRFTNSSTGLQIPHSQPA